MVVVSGTWVKNVAKYPIPIITDMVIPAENQNMAARAILTCRPNSHHFHERTLILDQPIKVGRSVARAKPTSNNAIFDCKVLSRHHALLWYEDGKFYLQDTQSSNGTFVNNNRLTAETEHHEVSSGDIVQFGVDVVENNRNVTHGCIVATLKLYLPDGKEAKASPSITEGDRQGGIPLDDLYKLNQVIQEAKQRELCLEGKLNALQQVIDETRKSAEESWQAYVGEERLLSRVSALENQLQQNSKNWGEDKFREELTKLQEQNETYQLAAKEALDKLHAERLEALNAASRQERAKISAEQDALLAKEQLTQAQLELEEVAQKLTEDQKKADEERRALEEREQELRTKLEAETNKVLSLEVKLSEHDPVQKLGDNNSDIEIYDIYKKSKEDVLAEIEAEEKLALDALENSIRLSVGPLDDDELFNEDRTNANENDNDVITQNTIIEDDRESSKHVHFQLPEDHDEINDSLSQNNVTVLEKEDFTNKDDQIDSKTLKYQYQSAQNELKRKIEILESLSNVNKSKLYEMEKLLNEEKQLNSKQLGENNSLREELQELRQQWKESCNENQQLKDRVIVMNLSMEKTEEKLQELNKKIEENVPEKQQINKGKLVSIDQLVHVEEELVLLKERFAKVGEEKLKLQHDLLSLTEKYNVVCNNNHNKHFFYFAPLVIMVLYLLVSAMIS